MYARVGAAVGVIAAGAGSVFAGGVDAVAIAVVGASGVVAPAWASAAADTSVAGPRDFAYRAQVITAGDAPAYRVSLPLSVYQKIVHDDLSDFRVFNGRDEPVPFSIERPLAGSVANAAAALPLFPLKDDSPAAVDALRVTIESGKAAINLQSGSASRPAGRISSYLVDGRNLNVAVAAFRLEWPDDAADFAGRLRVEAGDSLGDWRTLVTGAPVANLHSDAQRLVEQRVEFAPTQAKYWRLSWSGPAAPFQLTGAMAEPAKQSVDAGHAALAVTATAAQGPPGEFEYDLGAILPVDRVNLQLPEANTLVEVDLQSRPKPADPWTAVRRAGFYRLNAEGGELRNGPVFVGLNPDRYWRLRTDPKGGGIGSVAPKLVVEWVPHEVVFVARGAGPFYVAYGSAVAEASAVSLAMLPEGVQVASASLAEPQPAGGDERLRAPAPAIGWKNAMLWAVLMGGAGLLAWMAFRLARDFSRT